MTTEITHPMTRWLTKRSESLVFIVYATMAAFCTYLCVYGYRKAFAAAIFPGQVTLPFLPAMDLKVWFVIFQVIGYASSKFIGIKVISELGPQYRSMAIIVLIGIAELALLLFALTPAPWNAIWLLLNGVPLGMGWGLIFGFLEGRRISEILGAGLSASFIVGSGFAKTVGRWFLISGVPETWMPFVVGLVYLPPLFFFVWMLDKIPPPSAADEAARTKRTTMSYADRRRFLILYAPGMLVLTTMYMLLTAFRDFRDNFATELWSALGYGAQPTILTSTETPVAVGVLVVLASVMVIKSNRRALFAVHGLMALGTALMGVSTFLYQQGLLGPISWMVAVGVGLYTAYVPFGCVLFDRLIATVGFVGTSGFMIYFADAFGYLGSVLVLLYKNFAQPQLSWIEFFTIFAYVTSAVCTGSYLISMFYFDRMAGKIAGAGQIYPREGGDACPENVTISATCPT